MTVATCKLNLTLAASFSGRWVRIHRLEEKGVFLCLCVLDNGSPIVYFDRVAHLQGHEFVLLPFLVLHLLVPNLFEIVRHKLQLDKFIRGQLRVLHQVLLLVIRVVWTCWELARCGLRDRHVGL